MSDGDEQSHLRCKNMPDEILHKIICLCLFPQKERIVFCHFFLMNLRDKVRFKAIKQLKGLPKREMMEMLRSSLEKCGTLVTFKKRRALLSEPHGR